MYRVCGHTFVVYLTKRADKIKALNIRKAKLKVNVASNWNFSCLYDHTCQILLRKKSLRYYPIVPSSRHAYNLKNCLSFFDDYCLFIALCDTYSHPLSKCRNLSCFTKPLLYNVAVRLPLQTTTTSACQCAGLVVISCIRCRR